MSNFKKIIQKYPIWCLLFLDSLCGFAFQFTDQIPLNTNIRSGQLNNGFTYYIKQNKFGSSKTDMHLIVKVGSQHENLYQYQFTHLLEHILSSEEQQKYSPLLEQVGVSLANAPAWVKWDHTIYGIILPDGQREACMQVLPVFKNKLDLDLSNEKIQKERRTILNESNGGLKDKYTILYELEAELTGLAASPPKDLSYHLSGIKSDSLLGFYEKWYRPDLMALVIVGDLDLNTIDLLEEEIRRIFNNNKIPEKLPKQKNVHLNYLNKKPTFRKERYSHGLNEDKGESKSILRFYMRQPIKKDNNIIQNIKVDLVRKLLVPMLTKRFNEMTETYNSTYNIFPKFLDPPLAFVLNISVNGNKEEEVIKTAFKALKQVEDFGFSTHEFNEKKQDLFKQIKEMDTNSNDFWVNQIIDQYVHEEPIILNRKKLMEDLLKKMTLQEFNLLVKKQLKLKPDDIIIVGNTGDPIYSYSDKTIRSWASETDSHLISNYMAPQTPKFLLDPYLKKSLKKKTYKIKTTTIPGTKEYVLENGLRIILKSFPPGPKSSYEKNDLYFQGVLKKGLNCFSEGDLFSALNAPSIVTNSGVGGLDKFGLSRYLKKQEFEGKVYPYIENGESGIKGNIKINELETALQLVYLYFTSPNFNKLAFDDWKQEEKYRSEYNDLNREDFKSAIRESLSFQSDLPVGTEALEGIEETDFNRATEIYSQLFKNPEDYTFMFVGDFPEKEILNLSRKYLGNLPNFKGNSLKCKGVLSNQDIQIKPFKKSIPPSRPMKLAMVWLSYVTFPEPSNWNWREQIKTEVLRKSISNLIMERLRYKAGLIYQAGGGLTYDKSNSLLEFSIGYECLPENIEESILVSKELRDFLITEPISEALFKEVISSSLASLGKVISYKSAMKEMSKTHIDGEPWVNISEKRNYIESLTRHDLFETAKKYLKNEPYEFIMSPINNSKACFE